MFLAENEVTIATILYIQIISGIRSLLGKLPCLELRQAAAAFLGKCGSKDIPEHLEVTKNIPEELGGVPNDKTSASACELILTEKSGISLT